MEPWLPTIADSFGSVREAMIMFTLPFNCLGWPALSLPVGDTSVQIVGRAGDDGLVLAAGLSLERGTGKT